MTYTMRNREANDRELKEALCMSTYCNLYGQAPTQKEMVEWLGPGYLPDIIRYRSRQPRALVA